MPAKPTSPTPIELLKPKAAPDIVELPTRLVIARSGEGGPELPAFSAAIGALYGIAYTLKFTRKKAGLENRKVGVLEAEWGAEGVDAGVLDVPARDTWRWRAQLAVPDDTTEDEVREAIVAATTKKRGKLFGSDEAKRVELVRIDGRRYGRILHTGPYSTEPESFDRLEALLAAEGSERELWHVEVYLSDPSRTATEKLKTTLLAPLV
jgi:hypothetical protein